MNNNPKGAKNPKKPLIFYYAVMLDRKSVV